MAITAVENDLIELEQRYWQALKDKDADTAMQLTDDPCTVTGAQGVGLVDREAFTARMEAAPYTLDEFEVKDAKVRMLSEDVAILAYQVHEELTVEGKPVTLDAADSSTWVRRDGQWVCALHTEAITGDPFGRDRQPVTDDEDESATFEDEREIRTFIQCWIAASDANDLPKALGMMTDDVVFMVPGKPPFGKQEFSAMAEKMKSVPMRARSEVEEIVVMGDWAFCRTHLTVTMHPPHAEALQRSGHTLTILHKQANGAWLLARDANLLAEPWPKPEELGSH